MLVSNLKLEAVLLFFFLFFFYIKVKKRRLITQLNVNPVKQHFNFKMYIFFKVH